MRSKWIVLGVTAGAAIAQAQPAPPDQPPPEPPPQQPPKQPTDPYSDQLSPADRTHQEEPPPPPPKEDKPRPPDPDVEMPELLRSPTGWLLPAAVIYSKTSIDTGGGAATDLRVGLGDVAEFGVRTTDIVRAKQDVDAAGNDVDAHQIQPYLTATFRMGVSENRLFDGQPGLTLGFEKSFERKTEGFSTRTAVLSLVASKRFSKRVAIHVGGAFWDAELAGNGEDSHALPTGDNDNVTLHGDGVAKQIVPFGGVQLMPIDKSEILVDLSWAPEFCYGCNPDANNGGAIKLKPELSWGVRYNVASWIHLESGVRLPNIGNANLLDAEIFGSVTFVGWGLRHVVDDLKK